jgi:hypothetical protein
MAACAATASVVRSVNSVQLATCCRAEIFQLLVALIMLGVSVLFDQVLPKFSNRNRCPTCLHTVRMMSLYTTGVGLVVQVPFSGFGMMTRAIHTITVTRCATSAAGG